MVVQIHCKVTKQETDSVLVILRHEILGSSTLWLMHMAANKEVD